MIIYRQGKGESNVHVNLNSKDFRVESKSFTENTESYKSKSGRGTVQWLKQFQFPFKQAHQSNVIDRITSQYSLIIDGR